MRDVLDAFTDPSCSTIVFVCAAQMGKTEIVFAALGRMLTDGPRVPALYIGPTEKQVRSVSKQRIAQMIRSTPTLDELHHKGRYDSIAEKFFGGFVRLGFAHAGSATELASHPAGLLLVDENSRMESDISGEGSPVLLAMARAKNYRNSKVGIFSTPTVRGICPTWAWFLEGTCEVWCWQCPSCEAWFIPSSKALHFDANLTPREARLAAQVACTACGSLLPNEALHRDLPGKYIPHHFDSDGDPHPLEERPVSSIRSFWAPGLCSPWRTPGEIAESLQRARKLGPESVQTVVNTDLGEVYDIEGDAPTWQQVMSCAGGYRAAVPEGVQVVTAGVDVSKDRLWYVVRGWGHQSESWLLDHGHVWGEADHDQVWITLHQKLAAGVKGRHVDLVYVDSGYRPGDVYMRPQHIIYNVCRRHADWCACKGIKSQSKPVLIDLVDVRKRGTIKSGVALHKIDTSHFKSWIHERIRLPDSAEGRWWVPDDIDEDYCRQVTAEQLVLDRQSFRWVKVQRDNHYLDCEVLAAAAAHQKKVYDLPPLSKAGVKAERRLLGAGIKRKGIFD